MLLSPGPTLAVTIPARPLASLVVDVNAIARPKDDLSLRLERSLIAATRHRSQTSMDDCHITRGARHTLLTNRNIKFEMNGLRSRRR
jgi:hypothetical protein